VTSPRWSSYTDLWLFKMQTATLALAAQLHKTPNRMYIEGDFDYYRARQAAYLAATIVRRSMPKLSGAAARSIQPYYDAGYFGLRWSEDVEYLWYQNIGIGPYTMRSLSGHTIPMWIDDPSGEERKKNPKAKTREMSGRMQVLIFRRAALPGAHKTIKRRVGGVMVDVSVPQSFPGAAGRIRLRENNGKIARTNIGVRWYFPGLNPKHFLEAALYRAGDISALPRIEPKVGYP